jgi:electron transfer flavoprotein-quinone oxidoreductase
MPDIQPTSQDPISFDVIVVGAGMAGSSAAAIAARSGLRVALIERGQAPGAKNYFGGAIYPHALAEIYPDWQSRNPPLERPVTESGFWFLSRDGMVRATVRGGHLAKQPADAIVALRARFDPWWAEQAQKEGAFLIPKTTVTNPIRSADGAVIGVHTDRPQGDIFAPVTILCEGVNNLLAQKLGLIKHDVQPTSAVLAVKQLISLPADAINARFGLPDSAHGLAISVMGDLALGMVGQGFVYTGKECVSVGLGVMLNDLADYRIHPYELLQRFLDHPEIAPLVAGGQLMEYGAHIIPEGGWNEMPRLFADGVLVAGDAASMVSALHWEGTNMAILAGKEAAETAIEAHKQKDFSRKMLGNYRKRLEKRFIFKDLRQYRNLSSFLRTHPAFLDVYPSFLNEALGRFFTGFGRPKRDVYMDIFKGFLKQRNPILAALDMLAFGRAVLGI